MYCFKVKLSLACTYCIFKWIDKEENEDAGVETDSDADSGAVYL